MKVLSKTLQISVMIMRMKKKTLPMGSRQQDLILTVTMMMRRRTCLLNLIKVLIFELNFFVQLIRNSR
jgi:hypothetical protein